MNNTDKLKNTYEIVNTDFNLGNESYFSLYI